MQYNTVEPWCWWVESRLLWFSTNQKEKRTREQVMFYFFFNCLQTWIVFLACFHVFLNSFDKIILLILTVSPFILPILPVYSFYPSNCFTCLPVLTVHSFYWFITLFRSLTHFKIRPHFFEKNSLSWLIIKSFRQR